MKKTLKKRQLLSFLILTGTLVTFPLGAQYPDWVINSNIENPNEGDK